MREREPRLAGNEIALRILIDIPSQMFQRPILEAKMAIPENAIPKATITPEIATNVERLIKEATGLNMVVTVIEQPKEE